MEGRGGRSVNGQGGNWGEGCQECGGGVEDVWMREAGMGGRGGRSVDEGSWKRGKGEGRPFWQGRGKKGVSGQGEHSVAKKERIGRRRRGCALHASVDCAHVWAARGCKHQRMHVRGAPEGVSARHAHGQTYEAPLHVLTCARDVCSLVPIHALMHAHAHERMPMPLNTRACTHNCRARAASRTVASPSRAGLTASCLCLAGAAAASPAALAWALCGVCRVRSASSSCSTASTWTCCREGARAMVCGAH
eukprot:356011-Chlamydomonas_euryale.AAC.2